MPVRGNLFVKLPALFRDPTWTVEDCARIDTLRTRFPTVSHNILLCWLWKLKVPGLHYPDDIEDALAKMAI